MEHNMIIALKTKTDSVILTVSGENPNLTKFVHQQILTYYTAQKNALLSDDKTLNELVNDQFPWVVQ